MKKALAIAMVVAIALSIAFTIGYSVGKDNVQSQSSVWVDSTGEIYVSR